MKTLIELSSAHYRVNPEKLLKTCQIIKILAISHSFTFNLPLLCPTLTSRSLGQCVFHAHEESSSYMLDLMKSGTSFQKKSYG